MARPLKLARRTLAVTVVEAGCLAAWLMAGTTTTSPNDEEDVTDCESGRKACTAVTDLKHACQAQRL